FSELSTKNSIRLVPRSGSRGKILDRDGSLIAGSRLSYDVMLMSQVKNELESVIAKLSRILEQPSQDLMKEYRAGFIGQAVPVTIIKNIERKKAIVLSELKADLPGVIVQANPVRDYPFSRLAAHVLGYINEIDPWRLSKLTAYGYNIKDIVGFGGVEERYDYYLQPAKGGLSVQVDSRGRFVRVLGSRSPEDGQDVQLTLSLKLQKIAEEKLSERNGCVIIMDPRTGEVLAMTSLPNFNPGLFVDKNASLNNLFNNPDAPLINRAISAAYPAGSVFKPIVAAAAIQTNKINQSTSFLCKGSAFVGRQEFACWNTHGAQNLTAALTHSCNVFFYKAGLLLGGSLIHEYALKFGLAHTSNFELPYEAAGFVPSPLWRKVNKFQNWFDGDTANLSIGQGEVLVTPIQIARMMAVFANHGSLVRPYIVKSIAGKDVSYLQRKLVNLRLKEEAIEYVRRGLREVVSAQGGTAHVLSGLSISVAGKTGTAQAPHGQPHAWFAGFFPFKEPKFVACVFLEHGGPGYLSALIAKQIIEEMLNQGLI
ncbi:MAG TPA: penicillin-binding protein 2, partial [Candidatus Omnitrophota bacterium]|nr:penicillin-binding protein 2 [Candidatus Omnitrophota bacterium]